ncbi:catechol oxidase [Trifolium repens]|nr:catechol oxidase [Trifolium repens]
MTSPSKLVLPLLFALIILLLIPLNTNFIEILSNFLTSFHEKSNHQSNNKQESNVGQSFKPSLKRSNWGYGFIGFKNIEDSASISPLLLPEPPSTFHNRSIYLDASKCFLANLPNDAITHTNCCPPIPSPFKFKDFKDFASSNAPLKVRKAFHLVDEETIAKFEKGIALMKALPKNDPRSFYQQSKIHCAYCNGAYHQQYPFENLEVDIHRSWLFFPFHRMYLYFFERILGNLIGDPNFALPFWSWDSIEGMQMPKCFTPLNSSLYHKLRHHNHMPPHVVDLNYNAWEVEKFVPPIKQISFNHATMYKQMVLASTKELFMGSPLRLGDESHPGIGSVESAPHNTVHKWVGASNTPHNEDMGTFYTAARDPIFYPHHTNLDRLWVVWKNLGQGRKDYSDDLDWLETNFFFYDENANLVRVKISDSLDTKKLGYVYQDVNMPWTNFKPTSKIKSKELRVANRAKILRSKEKTIFPLVLDSIKSVIVKRPKKLRSKLEKEQEEEVLVIQGIEFGSDKSIKFDVHVNDDEDDLSDPDQTEFVGSFVSLPHGHNHKASTNFKVGISKVLENLEVDEDDDLVVTLVPKIGKGEIVIGKIMIEFLPKH